MESLPKDILEKSFSFLETKDLCLGVELVCKSFREVSKSSNEVIWKTITLQRYGSDIIKESVAKNAYNNSFRTLVADDNKLIAMPTINSSNDRSYPIPCYWKYNHTRSFFVCLVVGVQYHRPTKEIRFYIDVRGEWDLRNPNTCTIQRDDNGPITKTKGFRKSRGSEKKRRVGHYEGYVSFDASVFDMPGPYSFLYADPRFIPLARFPPDYGNVTVLNVLPGPLERTFKYPEYIGSTKPLYTLEYWSPFATDGCGDTNSKEKADLERFRPFVYHEVWKRHYNMHENLHKWWVGLEKRESSTHNDNDDNKDVYASFVDSLAENKLSQFRPKRPFPSVLNPPA